MSAIEVSGYLGTTDKIVIVDFGNADDWNVKRGSQIFARCILYR